MCNLVLLVMFTYFIAVTTESTMRKCDFMYEYQCYEYSPDLLSGQEAESYCRKRNARLPIIKNAKMNTELAKHMKVYSGVSASSTYSNYFWIGLNDSKTEGTFFYSDGTQLFSSNYSNWASGEPDSSTYENCVFMNPFTEFWYDSRCNNNLRCLCQHEGECFIEKINIPHSIFEYCYSNKTFKPGEIIRISCFEGFHLLGEDFVKCEANSIWSPLPSCVRGCPDPESVPHASLVTKKKQYFVGEEATYICDEGYYSSENKLKMDFTMRCKSNSRWTNNHFSCIQREKYITKEITLNPLASTALSCDVHKHLMEHKSWVWLRNSERINTSSTSDGENSESAENQDKGNRYFVDEEDGTLTINDASELTIGFYLCFAVGTTTEPGSVLYDVHLTEQCSEVNGVLTVEERLIHENDSLLLECPHNPRQSSSSWFKDGLELFSNDEFTLFPDGSLFISEARISHEGEYSCKIVKKFSKCSESITVKILLEASTSTICGYQKDKDQHPWTVSLWWKEEILPFCYGALINEYWIVTTAQCLSGIFRKKLNNVFVRFHYNSNVNSPIIPDISVALVKIHPTFSKKFYVNDIGLVKLKSKVNYTSGVLPICLSAFDFTITHPCDRHSSLEGIVSGWGPLEKDIIDKTPVLLESMKVLPHSECQSYSCDSSYSDKILCSIKTNDTLPTFAGDSGSPLVIESQGRMYLLGIYSWGERMVQLSQYDYFTKVSIYVPWIETYINNL